MVDLLSSFAAGNCSSVAVGAFGKGTLPDMCVDDGNVEEHFAGPELSGRCIGEDPDGSRNVHGEVFIGGVKWRSVFDGDNHSDVAKGTIDSVST